MLTSPAPGGDRGGRPERARRGRGGGGFSSAPLPTETNRRLAGRGRGGGGGGGAAAPRHGPPPCHAGAAAPPVPPPGLWGGEAAGLATGVWEGEKVQAGMEERGRQVGPVRWRCPVAEGERTTGVRQLFFLCREGRGGGGLFVPLQSSVNRAKSALCFG